jgi:hypothetical protein
VGPKKLNLPPSVLVDCKTYGASLAFIYSLEKELIAFNQLCSNHNMAKFNNLKNVLAFNGLWDLRSTFYKTAWLSGIAGTLCLGYNYRVVRKKFNFWTMSGVALAMGFGCYKYYTKFSESITRDKLSEMLDTYSDTYTSLPEETSIDVEWPGYTTLNEPTQLRPCAEIQEPDDEIFDHGKFYVVAPCFSQHIPLVPDSCLKNELVAVANRALMVVPQPSSYLWKRLSRFVTDEIIPRFCEIDNDDIDFNDWNNKFPPGRRKEHLAALEELELTPISTQDTVRSTFVKRELTLKGGTEVQEFDPRCIQGTTHRANVVLGPFMQCASKQLAHVWNPDNVVCYTSGMSAEQLGLWRSDFGDEDVTIVEIDFTRYDAHQGAECFNLERKLYLRMGLKNYPDAEFVFDSQRLTRGTTSHGIRYRVPFTRKSGDPNTSCGNSFITGCTALFILEELGFRDKCKLLVQGDDNLIVIRGSLPSAERDKIRGDFVNFYKQLGLIAKVKVSCEWHEVEFCSSLFWPTRDGFVLGPKIGRRLPKLGFSLSNLSEGQVKGMILCCKTDMSHIPVLRVYVKWCLSKMHDVKKSIYIDREAKYKSLCTSKHEICDSTFEFFTDRYGLDVDACEKELENALDLAPDFRSIISYPLLDDFIMVDC